MFKYYLSDIHISDLSKINVDDYKNLDIYISNFNKYIYHLNYIVCPYQQLLIEIKNLFELLIEKKPEVCNIREAILVLTHLFEKMSENSYVILIYE